MPGAVKYWFTAACFSSQTVGLVITDVLQQHYAEKALGEATYQVSINPASDCSAPVLLGGAGAWPQRHHNNTSSAACACEPWQDLGLPSA